MGEKTSTILNKHDIDRFRNQIHDEQFLLIFDILLETGCSVSELVEILCKDINKSQNTLYIRGKKSRNVALSKDLIQKITNQINRYRSVPESYLFKNRSDDLYTPRRVQQIFSVYSKQLKIKIKPHTLRKFRITCAILENDPLKIKKTYAINTIQRIRVLSPESIKKLKTAVTNKRNYLIIQLLSELGLKSEELLEIKTADCNLQSSTIKVTIDSGQKRDILLSEPIARNIGGLIRENELLPQDFLFTSRQTKKITQRRIQQIVKTSGRKIGITDLTPHILNATANLTIVKNNSLQVLSQTTISLQNVGYRSIEVL